jgi:hypothetical protein
MPGFYLSPDARRAVRTAVIEEGITNLGDHIFYGCSHMTKVTIPDSVTKLGNQVFYGCAALTSMMIPDGATSIGARAFQDCAALMGVTIPDSVESIGEDAFNNTAWFNAQPDGLVYAGKVAYKFKGEMSEPTALILSDDCKGISAKAFSGCTALTELTIPASVTNIGNEVFFGCTALKKLNILSAVTRISSGPLQYCSALESITLPASVTYISSRAFEDCAALQDVYYSGCEAQWIDVKIDEYGNGPFLNANLHFSETDWSTNGTWGDTIAWTFYENGKLVLSGEGRSLSALTYRGYPW